MKRPITLATRTHRLSPRQVIAPHVHHTFGMLGVVVGGECVIDWEGGPTTVSPKLAFWVPSGPETGVTVGRGEIGLRSAHVHSELTEPLDQLMLLPVSPLLLALAGVDRTCPEYAAAAAEMMLREMERLVLRRDEQALPNDPRLKSAVEWVRTKQVSAYNLDTLAARAGMSRRTLMRRFKAETGWPIHAWLRRDRLLRARIQISGGASVTEASFDAGYSSTSAFCTAYKATFGQTPTSSK